MIQMYTARTAEADELEYAMEEIQEQIDFTALQKNSCGILLCHMDFIESGLVAALCDALPFPTIGMTSMASADQRGHSLFELTLTVLTSDDVTFEVGMTDNITRANYKQEVEGLYADLRSRIPSDPAMILTLAPHVHDVAGYEVLAVMDAACNSIPIWGSITSGVDFAYEAVQTVCNGKHLQRGLAMMLIHGPVEPKFIVSSLPERNITNNRAVITKSKGAILYEINDMPVLDYLATVGLVINKENITTTPLMVYYDADKAPVALGFYTLFDDGSVLTGGELPEGTSFAVGSIDAEGIVASAQTAIEQVLACPSRQATLLFPCVTRYIMLAPEQERELALIEESLGKSGSPFMMGYSGGEICPMAGPDGTLRNRFHNYTFSACIL